MNPRSHILSVHHRFSAAAETYEQQARIQAGAAQKLMQIARSIPHPSQILDMGCGTGLLTRLLLTRYPEAQ
ncbi:MAG: hypothetical protein V2A34_10440, partial [Lentisphaerota bacterium]